MSINLPFHFVPGKLVVFEGLDDTGKSTQLARLEEACYTPQMGTPLYDPAPLFTHQPSGATGLGPDIYELTESVDWSQGHQLTRQLLHLAAHTEHYTHDIIPALRKRSVVMDRCWWSTFAYGWREPISNMTSVKNFMWLCKLPTQRVQPDLVFLFTHRYTEKASRRRTGSDRTVFNNYLALQEQHADRCVIVPDRSVGEVQAFISGELYKRGLVTTSAPKEV